MNLGTFDVTDSAVKKSDARKQSREALLERRLLVVRLHKEGVPVMQIVSQSGLNWATVKAALDRYEEGGELALMPAARGKKYGTGRSLTVDQEAEIRALILKQRPRFYKLRDSLWTRNAVAQLIETRFGIKLSVRGVSLYLTRWGIALPTTKKRPYARCSGEIKRWLNVNYAGVELQARESNAEIYWINKALEVDAALWCQTTGKKNETSNANTEDGIKKKRWMVSAINNQGTLRWAIIDNIFNADRQIKFVLALFKDAIGTRRKPLFLIRSDGKVFSSQNFKRWFKFDDAHIKIFPAIRDAI